MSSDGALYMDDLLNAYASDMQLVWMLCFVRAFLLSVSSYLFCYFLSIIFLGCLLSFDVYMFIFCR
jgi:hypothetical protein